MKQSNKNMTGIKRKAIAVSLPLAMLEQLRKNREEKGIIVSKEVEFALNDRWSGKNG